MKIKLGRYYGYYKGKEYSIGSNLQNLISYSADDTKHGFVRKNDGNNIYFIKSVEKSELDSVYSIESWGEVDGFPMRIWNIIDGKYSMEPTTKEMAKHFGVGFLPDKNESRYDAVLKSEEEIDSIWEVRIPIKGFPFNTEKVVYLKMYGEWLEDKNK